MDDWFCRDFIYVFIFPLRLCVSALKFADVYFNLFTSTLEFLPLCSYFSHARTANRRTCSIQLQLPFDLRPRNTRFAGVGAFDTLNRACVLDVFGGLAASLHKFIKRVAVCREIFPGRFSVIVSNEQHVPRLCAHRNDVRVLRQANLQRRCQRPVTANKRRSR